MLIGYQHMADSIAKINKPVTYSISEYREVITILSHVAAKAEEDHRTTFGHGVRAWPKAGRYVNHYCIQDSSYKSDP
jgi:hypothetical protein